MIFDSEKNLSNLFGHQYYGCICGNLYNHVDETNATLPPSLIDDSNLSIHLGYL